MLLGCGGEEKVKVSDDFAQGNLRALSREKISQEVRSVGRMSGVIG
ncbi:MAG: hypothetical protein NTZ01_06520 [Verrucomicrobia bacterium]|nr:hypothetical protein [Verrucomicrobiota bacterium]